MSPEKHGYSDGIIGCPSKPATYYLYKEANDAYKKGYREGIAKRTNCHILVQGWLFDE